MGQLYVYEPWPTAVDTMGLCGPLLATDATFTEERNGAMELEISHPIDPNGKWTNLVRGNLVRAMVPMHTTPEFNPSTGELVSTLRRTTVKADATRAQRAVYQSNTSTMRLATLQPGQVVFHNPTHLVARAKITWTDGNGYIDPAALETAYTEESLMPVAADIDYCIPPPRCRPQLFRIYAVSKSDSGVKAKARHVSYDNIGNITTVPGGEVTVSGSMGSAYVNLRDSRIDNHVFTDYRASNATETRDFAPLARVSPIEAILSPSGIAASWGRIIIRDNWNIYAVTRIGYIANFRIDHGLNMLGVEYSEDESNVIAQILPVGQTSKGKPLTIPDGVYTVDGVSVGILNGLVDNPYGDSYPTAHIGVMDMGSAIKAAGTTSAQLNAAYVKLIRAALRKFADERCDLPEISLSANFLRLGDTAEYAQYRNLERVLIHDSVPVRHTGLGVDVTTTVNKVSWDCLLLRYKSVDLGNVKRNYARTRVASWQVPGLASLTASVDTISGLI